MRASLNWLRELLALGALDALSIDELVSRLDMTGTAVEAVEQTGAHLAGIYVGQITSKERHPDSDHLWVTRVDIGAVGAEKGADEDGLLQIVCGAQNFEAGDKVPVATVGTVLVRPGSGDGSGSGDSDGSAQEFVIKKAKLRGVESRGMNCSARELGVGDDADGLMVLPADAPIGAEFAAWLGASDTILDLEITPNRPDCLSMIGVAREVAAVLDVEVADGLVPAAELLEEGESIDTLATVEVEEPTLCPRYTARVIRGVKVGPSPTWLAERVIAAGTRSINNIVDVTNFIMYELGQPLHAFDLNRIAKEKDGRAQVIVRRAGAGEKITTLDDVERVLDTENLLIADSSGPITLAGVMGAESTEVSDDTVDIFLEAAVFDAATTSRTSRKLALISESSLRFERGVDVATTLQALERAAALIAEVAGGTVAPGVIDVSVAPAERLVLPLRHNLMTRVIGEDIPLETAALLLERLGFKVERGADGADDALRVTVPTFRPDIEREIDLVEEVLRLWGMDNVTATLPAGRERVGALTSEQRARYAIDRTLRASGLNETMTLPFGDVADLEKLDHPLSHARAGSDGSDASDTQDSLLVELLNPMSSEQATLRVTMLPGLLRSVSLNKRRGVANVHLYELGKVFTTAAGRKQPDEREMAAAVLSGSWNQLGWNAPAVPLDFYDAKGIIEALVRELGVDRFRMTEPADGALPWLQPGKGAVLLLGKETVGWLGEIHPLVAQEFDIDDVVVAFEFDLAKFIAAAKPNRDVVAPPRYPGIEVDIALVVDEDVTNAEIEQRIYALGKKTPLKSVRLFDVYRGQVSEQRKRPGRPKGGSTASIPEGKKSMAYRLVYRADDRTLTAEEVDKAHDKLLTKLKQTLGAELRG
ncbi:MAG: phenylalanine--tRNA ligase subunit beta [Coriobacteriia bacterium]|nr:phenylalanine--tRNA ligase subunit beta [Coriobacteriia bacterium]